jgi:Na+-transporting methylmalonyl-CoA/oxaloacetate decarboxylase beta subunit
LFLLFVFIAIGAMTDFGPPLEKRRRYWAQPGSLHLYHPALAMQPDCSY